MGKDVGERIGEGYLAVPRDASQPRTSFEWGQLTLKKGSVQGGGGGGGQKKKVRTKQHGTRGGTIGDRRTKTFVQVRGHEPRSIAFRIGLVEVSCLGSPRLPALRGQKKGNIRNGEMTDIWRWGRTGSSIRICP